jgi:putative DNA primase/helicase
MNLASWADEAQDVLLDPRLKPTKLPELDARGNEIWRILLRIADHAGGDWPERARVAALELSGGNRQHREASTAVRLLGHIRDAFDGERMSCRSIVEALNADDQLPYGGWNDGKGINTRELGKKLAPYGVIAKTIRIGGAKAGNGYERDQFEDAWHRYLLGNPLPNRDTGTTRMDTGKTAEPKPGQNAVVPVSENGANPHQQTVVPVVPVKKHGNGTGEQFVAVATLPVNGLQRAREVFVAYPFCNCPGTKRIENRCDLCKAPGCACTETCEDCFRVGRLAT